MEDTEVEVTYTIRIGPLDNDQILHLVGEYPDIPFAPARRLVKRGGKVVGRMVLLDMKPETECARLKEAVSSLGLSRKDYDLYIGVLLSTNKSVIKAPPIKVLPEAEKAAKAIDAPYIFSYTAILDWEME